MIFHQTLFVLSPELFPPVVVALTDYSLPYYGSGNISYASQDDVTHSFISFLVKNRDVPDRKPFFSHFYFSTISLFLIKNTLVVLNPNIIRLQQKLDSLTAEEEDELVLMDYLSPKKHEKEFNIWNSFLENLRFGMMRDLFTMQLNRIYELLILPCVTRKTASALVKDVSKAAQRKYIRYGFGAKFGVSVLKTTLKSQGLFFLSVFTFNSTFGIYEYLIQMKFSRLEELKDDNVQEEIGKIIGFNAVQCLKNWVFAGIGAMIGSYIDPGLGTTIGLYAFPFVGNKAFEELLYRNKVKSTK